MGYSYFSIVGYLTYPSIFACTSFCAFACVNSAFSILSVNSVASVASVNSVLSIGSVNCFECVFNVPLQAITGRASNTCNKYSLVDGAHEAKELLIGLIWTQRKTCTNHVHQAKYAIKLKRYCRQ